MSKAYLNNLAEEGSRRELIHWLVKLDKENDELQDKLKKAELKIKGLELRELVHIM